MKKETLNIILWVVGGIILGAIFTNDGMLSHVANYPSIQTVSIIHLVRLVCRISFGVCVSIAVIKQVIKNIQSHI